MAQQKIKMQTKRTRPRKAQARSSSMSSPTRTDRSAINGHRSNKSAPPKASFDRYTALARAAAISGDRVETENFYQHAEHYFRLMQVKASRQ